MDPRPARERGATCAAVRPCAGTSRARPCYRRSSRWRLPDGHLDRARKCLLARLGPRRHRRSHTAGGLAPLETAINLEPCPECGSLVGGGKACQKLFEDLGLRAFEDSRYAAMR